MSQHIHPQDFKLKSRLALKDETLRGSFRSAMDYLQDKRAQSFVDEKEFKRLQLRGEAIRKRCLNKLAPLLEQLEDSCSANGIQVHWAQDDKQARQIVSDILAQTNAKSVVKGKSMLSEEIALNEHLEKLNIECLESDMGEYIVQLANEAPSHIIMPAIHKRKQEVAELFAKYIEGFEYTEDVDSLIKAAREVLRLKFEQADAGISGVNFAVAQTGTLCLVENEGNGRMTTTVPNVHIALMGIEKVVETLNDIPPLLSLLTRSATGQAITTYFNMISSPRKPEDLDGPSSVHLVLVDNGRSQAYADERYRASLQCIRCGACMNHCPVYARVGGHSYASVYPGPIGKIISPHLLGLEATGDLVTASSLCGACEEVCPVNIPIPSLLRELRSDAKLPKQTHNALKGQGSKRAWLEETSWWFYRIVVTRAALYRCLSFGVTRMGWLMPYLPSLWGNTRSNPQASQKTLHQLMRERKNGQ